MSPNSLLQTHSLLFHRCECPLVLSAIWWDLWRRKPHFCVHSEPQARVLSRPASNVTPHYQLCQSPLADMKHLLGNYIRIWRPIKLPPAVVHINNLLPYFIEKMSLCDLGSPLPSTSLPTSTSDLEHLQTYPANKSLVYDKSKPKTLNRTSTEQERLGKNN